MSLQFGHDAHCSLDSAGSSADAMSIVELQHEVLEKKLHQSDMTVTCMLGYSNLHLCNFHESLLQRFGTVFNDVLAFWSYYHKQSRSFQSCF